MKKQEFLDALGAGLSGSSDAEEVLDFYREMIEDRMEDGMEEEAAVEQLGAVEDILARCVQGLTVPKAVCETTAGSGISRVEIREKEFDVTVCEGTVLLHFRGADAVPAQGADTGPGCDHVQRRYGSTEGF